MLVLARKVGQRIFIGDDIVITIVETSNGKVRIGVDAPKSVKVFREELLNGGSSSKQDTGGDPTPTV